MKASNFFVNILAFLIGACLLAALIGMIAIQKAPDSTIAMYASEIGAFFHEKFHIIR